MLCWAVVCLNGGPVGHGSAAVSVGNEVFAFGGFRRGNHEAPMEVHVLNTVTLRWRKLEGERHILVPPAARVYHTAVLIGDVIYLWGGVPCCNRLYAFDVDAHRWSRPSLSGTAAPEQRCQHSTCVLGKLMFIHGGMLSVGIGYTNDIYRLDTVTMDWTFINTRGTPPPDSICHSATIIGTKMFVFGGCGDEGYHNTLRVFDTETNNWLTVPSAQPHPGEKSFHSAFAYNGELYVFGGHNHHGIFNDLWKFNIKTVSWKKVEPKGKRPSKDSGRCCCMVGDRIVSFGGILEPNELSVLDLSHSLNTVCKLAVIEYDLDQSGLPHNIRWELAATTPTEETK